MQTWLKQMAPCPSLKPPGFPARSLCGHFVPESGWVEARRVIYDHQLIMVSSGVFELQLEQESLMLGAHHFIIIPPGHWHTTICHQSGKRSYVHFDWEHREVPSQVPVMTFHPGAPQSAHFRFAPQWLPERILHGAIAEPQQVHALMERLEWMLGSPNPREQLASRGVLMEILIRLLDQQPNQEKVDRHQEELASRVRGALDDTLIAPYVSVSVCDLLAGLGYSYEHLARIFKKQYGLTPVEYLHALRIERAKLLLQQSSMTVAAIADALGYQDSIYFTRLFKRHTGQSPARYRKVTL